MERFNARRIGTWALVAVFLGLAGTARAQMFGERQAATPLGANLRQQLRTSAITTHRRVDSLRQFARDWSRRAGPAYNQQNLNTDLQRLLKQWQSLRAQFNALADLGTQLGTPQALNAISELDAGLNIIGELSFTIQSQWHAGTLDTASIRRITSARY